MKVSRLLVLSALWLVGLGANAADLIERTAPTVADVPTTAVAFEADHHYLMYNTGAGMFFSQGGEYGTRAVGNPNQVSATRVYFTKYVKAGEEWDGKTYYMMTWSSIRSTTFGWHYAFGRADKTHMFVDGSTSSANPYWEVEQKEGTTYYLKLAAVNTNYDGTTFVGRDEAVPQDESNLDGNYDNENSFPLSPALAGGEGQSIEWVFYDARIFETYDKAMELKTLIEAAEAEGIDVNAAVAVYNNLNATYDQVVKAIADLNQARANNIAKGTATNPTDASALIANPTFENASYAGWSGTAPNMTGSGSHGPANVAEHYNKTFNTYQKLQNMPAGVYCLSARTFFRGTLADMLAGTNKGYYPYTYAAADADTLTTLFCNAYAPLNTESLVDKYGAETSFGTTMSEATSAANGVTYYAPNDPSGFRVYCEEKDAEGNNKKYYETLLFFEAQGGEATIGVKKDSLQGGTDWSVFDTFGLKYYGNSAESYDVWVKNSAVKVVVLDGTIYTQSYMDAYNRACAATATNKAEALAAIAAIEAAAADLEKNIQLWKEFEAAVAEANVVINDATLRQSCRDDIDYWLYDNEEMNKVGNRDKYTNEQIEAAIAELRALILTAQKNPVSERDMTNLLANPDFQQGETGWIGFRQGHRVKFGDAPMPVTGGTATNTCAEAFSTDKFDLYQVVDNAPVGVYEIEVQGFCRNGRDNAWNNYVNQTTYSQPGKFPVYVYLNAKQTPFVNVFSETKADGYTSGYVTYEDNQYPNDMASAAEAFSAGMYKQKAYGLVAKDGDPIRIGVKGTSAGLAGEDDNWVIFDNFKLTFKGFQADVIKPVLDDEITKAEEKAQENMGKEAYDALNGAITAAKAATAGENGEAMFESLSDLFDAEAAADASILVFAPLSEALEKLQAEIEIYMDQNPTAAAAAGDLYGNIQGRLTNHDIADSEIEGLIDDINAAITAMKMPAYDGASDDNPIDMTKVLVNTTFDEGVSGWNGTTAGYNAEKGALGEFYNTNFDFYQTVSGLPEGTYQLAVQGFYRAGYADYDYQKRDSLEFSHAFLYAQSIGEETVTSSKQLMRLNEILNMPEYVNASIPVASLDELPADYQIAYTDTIAEGQYIIHVVPDMINTANDAFAEGMFADNVVTVKLAEGAKLRVGLKKETLIGNDWTIFDNFTLTYFGKNSAKVADGDISGVQDINLNDNVKFEYFTIDGRKATAVQKGIVIQKMTLSNGAVVVRKVRR